MIYLSNISNSEVAALFCVLAVLVFIAFALISRLKRKKEEAESDSLTLMFSDGLTVMTGEEADLFLISSDDRLVTNVIILLVDENDFTISRKYDSLRSGERIFVKQFRPALQKWKSAVISYNDCYGNIHKYRQDLI